MWGAALPFLRQSRRLGPTFDLRLDPFCLPEADLWIQAASAGEAFLALPILKQLCPDKTTRVLVTTTTDQGMEILEQGLDHMGKKGRLVITLGYFPFDRPDLIKRVIRQVGPKAVVLLETEIWPALFYHLKKQKIPCLILNGRMSRKSFRNYRLTRGLWAGIFPDTILCISDMDAQRYQKVFPDSAISTMPNIKFEAMNGETNPETRNMLPNLPNTLKLSILASLRRQEETQGIRMLRHLLRQYPDQAVAVFPRHMHRIKPWKNHLKKHRLDFILKSTLDNRPEKALKPGDIILWDRFGEMRSAYARASAVFVGGSLRPLGGQNFIEPVLKGTPTVIGPFWEDFSWVGKKIFDRDIVVKKGSWQGAARAMVSFLETPPDKKELRQKAAAYIASQRGGTGLACRAIMEALETKN